METLAARRRRAGNRKGGSVSGPTKTRGARVRVSNASLAALGRIVGNDPTILKHPAVQPILKQLRKTLDEPDFADTPEQAQRLAAVIRKAALSVDTVEQERRVEHGDRRRGQ